MKLGCYELYNSSNSDRTADVLASLSLLTISFERITPDNLTEEKQRLQLPALILAWLCLSPLHLQQLSNEVKTASKCKVSDAEWSCLAASVLEFP